MNVHPEVLRIDRSFKDQSEATVRAFEALDAQNELEDMQARFIKASGGSLEELTKEDISAPKKSTYDETAALVKEGKSMGDIVIARSLTFGTICDHLEKLKEGGVISHQELVAVVPSTLQQGLPAIRAAFPKQGEPKLAPLFGKLKGAYSYDELKLARLVILGEK